MEDVPKTGEESKREQKKQRRSSFLDSWRRLIGATEPGAQREAAEPVEAKIPFSERAWKTIQEFFGISKPESLEEQAPAEKDGHYTVSTLSEQKYPEKVEPEYALPAATDEAFAYLEPLTNNSLHQQESTPTEGGELIISHDEEPGEDYLYDDTPNILPAISAENVPAGADTLLASSEYSSPPEQIGKIVERMEKQSSRSIANADTLSRQRDRKLKREVVRLRRQVEDMEKEQKSLREEQLDFQAKADKEINRTKLEELKQRQHKQREILRQNRGYEAGFAALPGQEQVQKQDYSERAAPGRQQAESMNTHRPEAARTERPEEVLDRVKKAAERNVPIESAYERRHEIKDERPLSASGAQSSSHPAPLPIPASYTPVAHAQTSSLPESSYVSTQQPIQMYRTAVKSGFWTAVALLATVFVIYLVR